MIFGYDNSNVANYARLINNYIIAAAQHKITSRCSKVSGESMYFQVMLLRELFYLIANYLTLHWKSSWGVYRNGESSCTGYTYLRKPFGNFLSTESLQIYHSGVIAPCTLMTGMVEPLLSHTLPRYFF